MKGNARGMLTSSPPLTDPAVRTVVYLDHCARLSGGEIALARLLPALQRVRPVVWLAEDGPLVARLLRCGVEVDVLPMREVGRDLARHQVSGVGPPAAAVTETLRYARAVARRLRALRPALVHTNSLKSGYYGCLAARLAGVPAVWHLRDRIAPDYLPRSAVWATRGAVRTLPTAVVANSGATLATVGGASPRQLRVVLDDPYLRPVDPPRRGLAAGRVVVGMVGRLSPWKGQHVFIRAFARAHATRPQLRARIIGSALFGEDDYDHGLHRLVAELHLEGAVDFRGFREDIEAELDQLDVLVHASTVPEPFGQVVVEGMAAGLAVVAVNAGGPAEVVMDGVNGLLFPLGDVTALAAQLGRVADDATLRQQLGETARGVAGRFNPALVGRRLEGVYDRVAEQGR